MAWRCKSLRLLSSSSASLFRVPSAAASSALARTGGADAHALGFARSVSSVNGVDHTSKWMQSFHRKSPMQLINEVPPLEAEKRIVACTGGDNPALGHPVEFICLDVQQPAVCKYCGLRYIQVHH